MPKTTLLKSLAVCLLTSLFVLSAPVTAQRRPTLKSGMDAGRLSIIPVRLRSFVDKGAMAGAVALIARRGEIVMLEAVGYQDIGSKKPMRTDTIFDIRSVTKPITAIGIMILIEEGKLALNDPVEKYLPGLEQQ
jgi:CubicO group peptidase (beta-lactamase class C family)